MSPSLFSSLVSSTPRITPTKNNSSDLSIKPHLHSLILFQKPHNRSLKMADYSSCFRLSSTTKPNLHLPLPSPPSPATTNTTNPNLTTCLYQTHFGLAALTWSRNLISRALHVDLRFQDPLSSSSSFHLHMKPLMFWRKQGKKKFRFNNSPSTKVQIFWDLSKAQFSSGPEPQSRFFIAVTVDNQMTLLVGDLVNEAYSRTRARKVEESPQDLILRREHVFGNKYYTTKARFGGKMREILIECNVNGDEPRLSFSVDSKRVLLIKRLKWKFRGNERIEVDGVSIQVSWDVFNWLFEDAEAGHAVFMFRFEEEEEENREAELKAKQSGELLCDGYMNGFERKKLKRSSFQTRSSSSSSMSSGSSGSCSSVMEWASLEENELQSQSGFSLLVYAWKS